MDPTVARKAADTGPTVELTIDPVFEKNVQSDEPGTFVLSAEQEAFVAVLKSSTGVADVAGVAGVAKISRRRKRRVRVDFANAKAVESRAVAREPVSNQQVTNWTHDIVEHFHATDDAEAGLEVLSKTAPKVNGFLRQAIVEEQRYRCAICNRVFDGGFHIDHKLPQAKGGTSERANLWALCVACHHRKTLLENSKRVQDARNRTEVVQQLKKHQERLAELRKTDYSNSSLCLGCGTVYSSRFLHVCAAQKKNNEQDRIKQLAGEASVDSMADWNHACMF